MDESEPVDGVPLEYVDPAGIFCDAFDKAFFNLASLSFARFAYML